MAFAVFSQNGAIRPMAEAVIPLSSIEYTYGFGVYETIRVVRGTPLFVAEHLERLQRSAQLIGLQHRFDPATIEQWTKTLIKHCDADALNLKILLVGAREAADALLSIIPMAPHFPEKKLFKTGVAAMTVTYERPIPQAKTLSMLGSYLAYRKAKQAGCFEALLLNQKGEITEGTGANFFAITGRTILSPPAEEILYGVTMAHVLAVARDHGFTFEHRTIRPEDLKVFDGAFLTSTSCKIMPITQIDDLRLQVPDSLAELIRHYDEHLTALLPQP